jgi:hypothetical protein
VLVTSHENGNVCGVTATDLLARTVTCALLAGHGGDHVSTRWVAWPSNAEAERRIRLALNAGGDGDLRRVDVRVLMAEYDRRGDIEWAATRFVERNYTGSLGPDDLGRLLNDIAELACVINTYGRREPGDHR